jgi:alkylation response protein AidB-like acyl-CoA dehydrogenase
MTAATFRHRPMLWLEDLERHLGDHPADPAADAALDAADAFPTAAVAALQDFGLHRHYIPEEHGGLLRDYETAVALVRAVAGRDLTVAIAHGKTFLGAVCVWVAGDSVQARRVADDIAAGRPISWGLTEREHGSDLVAGELLATADGRAIRLDGEKFLINNATRGEVLCVLARVDPEGGPRGFSLFLVDKRQLADGALQLLPKVRTIGIRGADISGFRLSGAVVDSERDRVGADGHGLETVLKSLQLTRTLCAALSLGAADHALRQAVTFAEDRELYGRRLIDLPAAARTLSECYADHLLNEAFSLVVTRSIQALPGELSVLSAAVKYLVPVRTEAVLTRLRRLLGARAWLRDVGPAEAGDGLGRFQKIERDHRIVALFDGNTVVNLNALVSQFPVLTRAHRNDRAPAAGLAAAADLAVALPVAQHDRLRLVPAAGVSLLHGLGQSVAELAAASVAEPALAPATRAAARLHHEVENLLTEIAEQPIVPPDVPPQAFVLAHRLSLCVAGAAAVALWLGSRGAVTDPRGQSPWRDGAWLLAVLNQVLASLDPVGATHGSGDDHAPADDQALDAAHATLLAALREQVRGARLTSLLPARLAGAS